MSEKVLIVDDNNIFSRVIKDELQIFGHETETVSNGVDALLRYIDGGIDIVVMDVMMPKLSGIDAMRIIKKIDPAAKVVVITGNPNDILRKEAADMEALEFLIKPFSLKSLIQIIKAA